MKHKNYDSNCGAYLICQNCDMLICYNDASEKELDEMLNGECKQHVTGWEYAIAKSVYVQNAIIEVKA